MKNCYKFKSLISNYIDKEISFRERKFFESHIEECVDCKTLFASVSATRNQMQRLPQMKVNDDFMDSLRSKILADRNSKILASQSNSFSWKRIPAYTYALSSLLVIVVVGFTMMKVSDRNSIPLQQMPLATQEKIDDAKKFQQKFDATPAYLKNDNLANTQVDSMVKDEDNTVKNFDNNLSKVGYQKK